MPFQAVNSVAKSLNSLPIPFSRVGLFASLPSSHLANACSRTSRKICANNEKLEGGKRFCPGKIMLIKSLVSLSH